MKTAEEKRAYYRSWYAKNKERVQKKRAEKYAANPEINLKHKEWLAKYREEGREPQGRVYYRELNGKTVKVLSLGAAELYCEVGKGTIAYWDKKGWIPKPSFPDDGLRLYTEAQCELLKRFKEECTRRNNTELEMFKDFLTENWEN